MSEHTYDVVVRSPQHHKASVDRFERVSDLQMFLEKLPTSLAMDETDQIIVIITKIKKEDSQ